MEVGNMLDVLYYLLDEDFTYASAEQAEFKSNIRETLSQNMYKTPYKYKINTGRNTDEYDEDNTENAYVPNGGASNNEVMPFIPPTPFNPDAENPFQGALRETPLG
jgi:hypothetical protein